MNNTDPMGTRILVSKDAMDEFSGWATNHLSSNILSLFSWSFPQNWEGSYSEFAWRLSVTQLNSTFSELQYNGGAFDVSKLKDWDKAFLAAAASDDVYIFDKNGFRKKSEGDGTGWSALPEKGLRTAGHYLIMEPVVKPIANGLAALGDVAEKYNDTLVNLDQSMHGGAPGVGQGADLLVALDEGAMAMRSLRITEKFGTLSTVVGDLKTISLVPRRGLAVYSDITGGAATNAIDLFKRTQIRGLTPSEYIKWAVKATPDPLRVRMPWAMGNYGVRILDHFNQLTETGYEGTLLKWSQLMGDEAQFQHKLRQAAMDQLILNRGLGGVKNLIWFGTEPIPPSGPISILGEDLSKAGIEYKVIPPPGQ